MAVTRNARNPKLDPKIANVVRSTVDTPRNTGSKGGNKDSNRQRRPRAGAGEDVYTRTENDLAAGRNLFGKFADFGDLPRVTDAYAQNRADQLELRKSFADPRSAAFAGRRSTDIQDILGRMKSGLEGYTAAENQAMREAQDREIDTVMRGDVNQARDTNASNLVFGGAAAAREDAIRRAAAQSKAINEQNLFIKNADEKRSRLDAYGNAVTGAEKTEFGQGQKAISDYENYLGDASKVDLGIQGENINLEKDDRNAQVAGLTGFADLINTKRDQDANKKAIDQFYRTRVI